MKFFLDTANLEELKAGARWGIIDGVTTNPSLIAKEGVPLEEQIRKICDIINGDISAEVVATETDEMLVEGRKLAKIHKNVVVKVPLTRDGIRACSIFSREGIRVNVTLCFSAGQALLAAKAGAYFVSPFVGRLDDIGCERHGADPRYRPDLQELRLQHPGSGRLAAATPTHVIDAAKAGAHIGTLPFKVMDCAVQPSADRQGAGAVPQGLRQSFSRNCGAQVSFGYYVTQAARVT